MDFATVQLHSVVMSRKKKKKSSFRKFSKGRADNFSLKYTALIAVTFGRQEEFESNEKVALVPRIIQDLSIDVLD